MKHQDKIKALEDYLKEAFCVDGECVNRGFDMLVSKSGESAEVMTFKLTDSKRGEFLVSLSAK